MLGLEGLAEETLGGFCVARLTEQKIDGLAGRIDRNVYIIPLLLDLNICLIDAVRVVLSSEMRAAPLVEFRSIPLHPPKHGGVIDGHPLFSQ